MSSFEVLRFRNEIRDDIADAEWQIAKAEVVAARALWGLDVKPEQVSEPAVDATLAVAEEEI